MTAARKAAPATRRGSPRMSGGGTGRGTGVAAGQGVAAQTADRATRAGAPGERAAGPGERTAGLSGWLAGTADRLGRLAASWGPTAGRMLLGLVLAWFGYHELIQPGLWTGYVPGVQPTSATAIVLVLAHGWLLLVLAVALIAGIAVRAAAGVAALLLAQIVISLWASAGLSDLTLRDVGVLGLALCLTGRAEQRLALTS